MHNHEDQIVTQTKRDEAIGEFFVALAELTRALMPLVALAVEDQRKKGKLY